ncbi:MAG: DUF1957 domain-containing protein [Elusimicrobia bacterium]|nr:DUF1957 domain-containing protein [Elusimicrobiota bacterium]
MSAAFTIVLAAHRPWVRSESGALEEDWFFGALAGAYLPLVRMLERLHAEGVRAPVAWALSSTLTALLDDDGLRSRAAAAFAEREELCGRERRSAGTAAARTALAFHAERFRKARRAVEGPGRDLAGRLRRLEEDGAVELLAGAGTNALLPLARPETAAAAHLRLAGREQGRRFGRPAAGVWLPECGYDPAVGVAAAACGFEYAFVESRALAVARPRPRCGSYAPVRAPGGLLLLGRDPDAAPDAAKLGPYAHPDFCEPNRDLGLERAGRPCGLTCHRVTGDVPLRDKAPYDPAAAALAARATADAFADALEARASRLEAELKTRPVLTALWEAELFGQEWLEGPLFLERLLRRLAASGKQAALRTPEWVVNHAAEAEDVEPETSSWGPGGYFEPWLNDDNAWMLPHAHGVAERMAELAARYGPRAEAFPSPLEERALNACCRLAVLSQSSDWPCLAGLRSHARWAAGRLASLVEAFLELRSQLEARRIEPASLAKGEALVSGLLPGADFRVFIP